MKQILRHLFAELEAAFDQGFAAENYPDVGLMERKMQELGIEQDWSTSDANGTFYEHEVELGGETFTLDYRHVFGTYLDVTMFYRGQETLERRWEHEGETTAPA